MEVMVGMAWWIEGGMMDRMGDARDDPGDGEGDEGEDASDGGGDVWAFGWESTTEHGGSFVVAADMTVAEKQLRLAPRKERLT